MLFVGYFFLSNGLFLLKTILKPFPLLNFIIAKVIIWFLKHTAGMQMNVTKSLQSPWRQAHRGYWKWSNTHYKLTKNISWTSMPRAFWDVKSSLSRLVCAKTRLLGNQRPGRTKGFLPFTRPTLFRDSKQDERMVSQSLNTEWALGFEPTEQKTKKKKKNPEKKIQCWW